MPLELVAGKPATLGVLTPDGHVAPDAKILLSSGETLTTDESGRAHFLAPAKLEILYAHVEGTEISAASDIRPDEGAARLQIKAVPRLAPVAAQMELYGSGFEGDADRNEVSVEEKRALVLAASPTELVILPPPDSAPGAAKIDLKTDGQDASASVTLVRSEVTSTTIPPRKKTKISIRISGTEEPVSLEVHNAHPEVVQFADGGDVFLQTRGGPENSATVQVKGLRAGEFSFSVRLLHDLNATGIPTACIFLEAGQKIAPGAAKGLFQKILKQLKKRKPDASAIRREFQKLISGSPAGDYGALVRAAEQALFPAE